MTIHLSFAGDVPDDALFCAVLFSRDVLDVIWDWFESVLENFLTYSCNLANGKFNGQ